ncbi:hypothetical protein HDZ31DRAFT_33580 [Schizophyllum fasciatum]
MSATVMSAAPVMAASSASASHASRPPLLTRASYQSDVSRRSTKARVLEVFEAGQPVRVRYRYGGLDKEYWASAIVVRPRDGALYEIELPVSLSKTQRWTVSARDLRSVSLEQTQNRPPQPPIEQQRANVNDVVFAEVSNGAYSVFVPARVVEKDEGGSFRVMFLDGMLKGKTQTTSKTEVYSKERASALKKAGRNVLGAGAKNYRF